MTTIYLPNNGTRYCKKRATQINDSNHYHFCPKYIAFYDTKPENNNYCKVNKLNHLERSIILRKKLEKIKMDKNKSLQTKNLNKKKKMLKNKRNRNRKRKRDENNIWNDIKIKNKKRKIKRVKQSNDDEMKFIMSQILDENDVMNDNDNDNRNLFDKLNDF